MILVLGSRGQLGQELVALATRRGLPIVGISRADADIVDPEAVRAAIDRFQPSVVVNCAAYNQVDLAETEVEAAQRANAIGPTILATVAAEHDLPIVHVSTDFVFDGRKSGAWREDDDVRPINFYGRSKAEGEAGVRRATGRHFILRTSWLFGPYGSNFVKTIIKLAGERDSLRVIADTRGSPTSTADLAHAILLAGAATGHDNAPWGTYHVAGAGSASRFDQANAIVEAQARFTGRMPEVVPVQSLSLSQAAPRPVNTELDSSKFAAAFGFQPAPWRPATERVVGEILAPRVAA